MGSDQQSPKESYVLQLSDLFIEDSSSSFCNRLRNHAQEISRKWNFRYLAISGNLTAGGAEDHFKEAEKFLISLARTLFAEDVFEKERDEEWLRRILVVPGPRDADADNSDDAPRKFTQFNRFYERLFLKYDYDERPLPSKWHVGGELPQPRVRILPDLTSVGFFWDERIEPDSPKKEKCLWHFIADKHRFWSKRRCLVLLSSHLPKLVADEQFLNGSRDCIYMVGRRPQPMLGKMTFGAPSWTNNKRRSRNALGCIYRLREKANKRTECRIQVFDTQTKPVEIDWIKIVGPEPSKDIFANATESLVRKVGSRLDNLEEMGRSLHLIRGLPGTGKNQFFRALKTQQKPWVKVNRLQRKILVQPIEFWPGDYNRNVAEATLRHYQRLLEDRMASSTDPTIGMLLIFDHSERLGNIARANSSFNVEWFLFDLVRQFHPGSQLISTVFMTNAESELESRIKAVETPDDALELDETYLDIGPGSSFRALLSKYESLFCEPTDLMKLCGGMCGLGTRLLDAIQAEEKLGRVTLDSRSKRWDEHIKFGRNSRTIRDTADRFRSFFETAIVGAELDNCYELFDLLESYANNFRESPFIENAESSVLDRINEILDGWYEFEIVGRQISDLIPRGFPLLSYLSSRESPT